MIFWCSQAVKWLTRLEPSNLFRGSLFKDTMVNSIKRIFISCDVPMAMLITHLNSSLPPSQKFIIQVLKLDSTCMFVKPHGEEMIRDTVSKFRNQNSYQKPA